MMVGSLKSIQGILQFQLFAVSGTTITVMSVLIFAIVIVGFFWISFILQRGLRTFFRVRGVKQQATIGVGTRLLHYCVMLVGIGVGLNTVGINLSALFAAGAVFAVGIGFAMQNILQNFVSGVILLAERTIKPNDILEIDGRIIRVVELGARATVGRTLDEEDLIIPNSTLVQGTVKNYTLRDALYRLRVLVGVTYDSDMKQVRDTLEKTTRQISWQARQQQPVVLLNEFGSSSVDFEVSVWIEDPWRARALRSELRQSIWWALKEARITIAFPQLDVHFDPPVVASLESLRKVG
jgi:small-conductance mechanosensitive channel